MDHIVVCPSDMQGISGPQTVLRDTVHVIFLCSLIPASSLQLSHSELKLDYYNVTQHEINDRATKT